jgi:diguanylate cyclase (GGDEF)-like protein
MDPQTLVAVLGLHLATSGGLLWVLSRQMPDVGGVPRIAAGAMLFGAAYGLRIHHGLATAPRWIWLLDGAMLLSSLLLATGLRQFVGRAVPGAAWIAGASVAFAAAQWLAARLLGDPAPRALLALALGSVYAVVAWTAHRDARTQPQPLRLPLASLRTLMGFLAAITLARGLWMLRSDPSQAFQGPVAQAYYAGATLTAILLGPTLIWLTFSRLTAHLLELATHDSLTRTLNRKGLDEALRRHFGMRQAPPITLMHLDVDDFKRINDEHGHVAGDRVLHAIGARLTANLRAGDIVARTGGDEFMIGFVGGDAADARTRAEQLRAACSEPTALPAAPGTLRATVSIGVSEPFVQQADRPSAELQADRALYAAKGAGRDSVVLHADPRAAALAEAS